MSQNEIKIRARNMKILIFIVQFEYPSEDSSERSRGPGREVLLTMFYLPDFQCEIFALFSIKILKTN
jgi:hypothetical protein